MKEPLGIVDSRVKMTDTPPDGFFSASFSSVIALDDPQQHTTAALGDFRALKFGLKRQCATDETGDAAGNPSKDLRHPRLELDVALDKYHVLDGLTEPLNPQNTPASYSGCNSPGEMSARGNENLRSRSAPASRALGLSWSEDQSAANLIYLHGYENDELEALMRRAPGASQPSTSSPEATKDVQTIADGCASKEAIGGDLSLLPRCVRFSPPLKYTAHQTIGSAERPIPSVERKQDYIASHRQHRQREKCGSPNRARARRYAPYRSPDRIPESPTTRVERQPDFQFSLQRNERSRSPSPESHDPPTPGQEAQGVSSANLKSPNTNPVVRQAYDLALISFSLYQYRLAGTWRFNVLRLIVRSAIVPVTAGVGDELSKRVNMQVALETLLFHASFVVPAIILRVLSVVTAPAERAGRFRICREVLRVTKVLWLLFIAFVKFVVRSFGVSDGHYWDFSILYGEI